MIERRELTGDDFFLSEKGPKRYKLDTFTRAVILILIFIGVVAVNMTMSIFKVCSGALRTALGISDIEYGFFASLFHLGTAMSTFGFMYIIRRQDHKKIVVSSLVFSGLFLILFKFSTNKYILMPIYFLVGFFAFIINIYTILWIDRYGMFRFKTLFLNINGVCKSLGVACAFTLNFFLKPENYGIQFLVEAAILLTLAGCFSTFSKIYFNRYVLMTTGSNGEEIIKFRGANEIDDLETRHSSIYRTRYSNESSQEMYIYEFMIACFKNPVWLNSVFANSILLTATGSFSFWVMDHFNNIIVAKDEYEKLVRFYIVSLVGPLLSFVINAIIAMNIGNYYSRLNPHFMFIFYCLSILIGNIIPYTTDQDWIMVLAFLFFSFSTSVGPYLSGINLSGGTPSRRPFGVMTANLCNTLFGAAPAMTIYGLLISHCGGDKLQAL